MKVYSYWNVFDNPKTLIMSISIEGSITEADKIFEKVTGKKVTNPGISVTILNDE